MLYWLTVAVAVAFGIARLVMPVTSEIHHEDIFKDAAHLFVGAMYGAGFVGYFVWTSRRVGNLLYVAIALTVLEVVAFFLHKS